MGKTKKQIAEEALKDAEREYQEAAALLSQRRTELLALREEIEVFPLTGDTGKLALLKSREQALGELLKVIAKTVEGKGSEVRQRRDELTRVLSEIESIKRQITRVEYKLGPNGDTPYKRRQAELELQACQRLQESDEAELKRLKDWLEELQG